MVNDDASLSESVLFLGSRWEGEVDVEDVALVLEPDSNDAYGGTSWCSLCSGLLWDPSIVAEQSDIGDELVVRSITTCWPLSMPAHQLPDADVLARLFERIDSCANSGSLP